MKNLLVPNDIRLIQHIENALNKEDTHMLALISADSSSLKSEIKKHFFNTLNISNIHIDTQSHFFQNLNNASQILFIDISRHEKPYQVYEVLQDNIQEITNTYRKIILFLSNEECDLVASHYHRLYDFARYVHTFTSIKKNDFLYDKKEIVLIYDELDESKRYDFFFETAKDMMGYDAYEQAIGFWEKAEKSALFLHDDNKIAITQYSIGICLNAKDEHKKAQEFFQKAQQYYHDAHNHQGEMRAEEQLGKNSYLLKEYFDAQKHIQAVKSLYLTLGYQDTKADISLLCASIKRKLGHYDEALKLYIEMVSLFQKDSTQMAEVYMGFGEIYRMRKEYDRALKNYFKATYLYKKLGLADKSAYGMMQTAYIYSELGRYVNAQECKTEAVNILHKLGENDKADYFVKHIEKYVKHQQTIRLYTNH